MIRRRFFNSSSFWKSGKFCTNSFPLRLLSKCKNQELEAQQQAAEVASQAKSQFLAMMSHELRTPLNSILGLSTVLSQQVIGDLNSKQLEYLDCIRESGEHLLALISDILDLSKVEAGQEQLVLTDVAVVPLCQSCIAMVEPRAIAKGLTLSCQVEPGAESCVADDRRLRQMLLNLLSNAVKFTHIGHISLTVQPQGAMLQFAVEDTGIGIPDERRDQLFQPFTQLDSDLNRHYEGTGLGLALTQQLAQLHGGYLTVESEVERGSRFLLYLPLAPARVRRYPPLAIEHLLSQGRRLRRPLPECLGGDRPPVFPRAPQYPYPKRCCS